MNRRRVKNPEAPAMWPAVKVLISCHVGNTIA
jgi:hypothetical protein